MSIAEQPPENITVTRLLDVTGLNCPLPLLKTKAELARLAVGDVLHVLASDPLAPLDFRAYCLRAPHELLWVIESAERSEFYIRKA